MKYYFLKIGDTVFSNVSAIEILGKYRNENVQQNLNGDYIIDRIGSEKLTISAKINLLTISEMNALRAAKDSIFCEISFDRGDTRVTRTMHIADFTEPTPIYLYGNKSKGIRYGSITIKAEER